MAEKAEHPSIEDRQARGLTARAGQNERDYKEFVNAVTPGG